MKSALRNNEKNDPITYEKFMAIPIAMYNTVGIELLRLQGSQSFWTRLNFWIGFVNLNIIIAAEFIFFYKTFGQFSSFLEATAIAPCLGFCVMSDFKVATILTNIANLDSVQGTLRTIFPQTAMEQTQLKVKRYRSRMVLTMICFLIICNTLIWLFNLSAIGQSIIGVIFYKEEFVKRLAYLTWYPFEIRTMRVYLATYFHQIFAGYTAVMLTIGADILLCCSVNQLIMHFARLANQLREFNPTGTDTDLDFLRNIIARHQVLLKLCEQLNTIFSTSILFNFMASSLIICFVGFQATAGVTPLELFKYLMFLLGSSMQILVICYYGDKLIDSSCDIVNGAYENNWVDANQRYKKLLVFVIFRGQKASALRAVTFGEVSLRSFMKVCNASYQFFALLRTVYSK